MKKCIYTVFLISFLLSWNSCKKNDEPVQTSFRVTGAVTWMDDKLSLKKDFIYQDDKLKTIQYYVYNNPDWILTNKEEYEYPSEEMRSFIHYYNLGGKTWTEVYKIECYSDNGKVTKWLQYHHEAGDWTVQYEEEFVYTESGLLGEWSEYDYSTGSRTLIYQEKYFYNGQQIEKAEIYKPSGGNMVLYARFDLHYETESLKQILVSIKEPGYWRENSRMDLSYLNGELMSSGLSFKDNDLWIQTDTWSYNYDESGNLSGELNDDIFHNDVEKTEYSYEQKPGNVNDFDPPVNWVFDGYWCPQVTAIKKPGTNARWLNPCTIKNL